MLGLGSYLLFIGTFIFWFVSRVMRQVSDKNNSMTHVPLTLETALFSGWISVLVTNFFGFSVVIVQLFLFLFPAIIVSSVTYSPRFIGEAGQVSGKNIYSVHLPRWSGWFAGLFCVVLIIVVWITWYADTLYAAGYRASRAGQYDVAVDKLSRAQALSPFEPLFTDELGSAYAGLVTVAIETKDATRAAILVKGSLASSDRAITISPKNVNFWKTRTKIYYTFSGFDPAFNDAAIEALLQARTLSPKDPKISYNLAILYGRKGTNDKAIEELKTTIALKPNYRDGYYALWVFYTEIKKSDLAREVLNEYLAKVDPGDKDFLERLNQ